MTSRAPRAGRVTSGLRHALSLPRHETQTSAKVTARAWRNWKIRNIRPLSGHPYNDTIDVIQQTKALLGSSSDATETMKLRRELYVRLSMRNRLDPRNSILLASRHLDALFWTLLEAPSPELRAFAGPTKLRLMQLSDARNDYKKAKDLCDDEMRSLAASLVIRRYDRFWNRYKLVFLETTNSLREIAVEARVLADSYLTSSSGRQLLLETRRTMFGLLNELEQSRFRVHILEFDRLLNAGDLEMAVFSMRIAPHRELSASIRTASKQLYSFRRYTRSVDARQLRWTKAVLKFPEFLSSELDPAISAYAEALQLRLASATPDDLLIEASEVLLHVVKQLVALGEIVDWQDFYRIPDRKWAKRRTPKKRVTTETHWY